MKSEDLRTTLMHAHTFQGYRDSVGAWHINYNVYTQCTSSEASTGEASAGEASAGEASTGEASAGEASAGEASAGEATPGCYSVCTYIRSYASIGRVCLIRVHTCVTGEKIM